MTPREVGEALQRGAVILDLRPPRLFASGHLPGAVNLQFNRADLAERAAMVLPIHIDYVVHGEPDPIALMAVEILERSRFKVAGHLAGGLRAWQTAGRAIERLRIIDVDELRTGLDRYLVVDAREGYEHRHGHIADAILFPSGEAWNRAGTLSSNSPLAVVCGDQVRASFVASILSRTGREAVLVMGGMADWQERGYPLENDASIGAS